MKKEFEKLLKTSADRYFDEMGYVAKKIEESIVYPFCDKYNLKFTCSNGAYNFSTSKNLNLLDYNSDSLKRRYGEAFVKEWDEVVEVLELLDDVLYHPMFYFMISNYKGDSK